MSNTHLPNPYVTSIPHLLYHNTSIKQVIVGFNGTEDKADLSTELPFKLSLVGNLSKRILHASTIAEGAALKLHNNLNDSEDCIKYSPFKML